MRFWQPVGLVLLLNAWALPSHAISVSATDWQHTLPNSITNAGDYYDGTLTTNTSVTVSGASSQNWTLSVRLTNTVTGMTISVQRTGNGSGDSIPAGGTNSFALTTAFQPLSTGTGNIAAIPLEYQIQNFDVSDGNGNKAIPLEYQITTTP